MLGIDQLQHLQLFLAPRYIPFGCLLDRPYISIKDSIAPLQIRAIVKIGRQCRLQQIDHGLRWLVLNAQTAGLHLLNIVWNNPLRILTIDDTMQVAQITQRRLTMLRNLQIIANTSPQSLKKTVLHQAATDETEHRGIRLVPLPE